MNKPDNRVVCETPTPGKQPTRIEAWKYDLVRQLILDTLPTEPPGLAFKELAQRVKTKLTAEQHEKLGSVSWYTTTVKLDLEVKGEVARVTGARNQHLTRS